MTDQLARLATALADRYRFERELGAGGMATVFLAEGLKHDRHVAIKVLRPDLVAALGPERFLREVKIAANLQHPHILPLHDSGEADGFLYYVMPFVDGISLREKLAREGELPIPMTPRSDSSLPTNVDDLARARRWQGISDRRHERPKLGHPVGPGVDHDDRHTSPRDVLLEGQVAIHGDQVSEPGPGHRPEKVAIAAPKPALICHGGHVKRPGNALWSRFGTHSSSSTRTQATGTRCNRRSLATSSAATACSRRTLGKSARNSSRGSPASRYSSRVWTGTRVPTKTRAPPMISGSRWNGRGPSVMAASQQGTYKVYREFG